MPIVLSPSSLSDFARCKRCWWLDKVHELKWPRGIFPSLPGGIDRRLKDYYDFARTSDIGLPPEMAKDTRLAEFVLFRDQALLKKWRFWKTGLKAELTADIIVSGALDDLLAPKGGDKPWAMLDYKSRGAPPVPGDTEKYYGIQANCYSLMLEANGMKTGGKGYFAYYWPQQGGVKAGVVSSLTQFDFGVEIVEIMTDPNAAFKLAMDAAQCLEGPLPKVTASCEQCAYSIRYFNTISSGNMKVTA